MSEIFEIIMIVSFGFSWPMNIIRSVKSKTAAGKSLSFLLIIMAGYVAGIISKFTNPVYMENFAKKWYVLVFYFLNFIMVFTDTCLYFKNKKLDNKRAAQAALNAEQENGQEAEQIASEPAADKATLDDQTVPEETGELNK